MDALGESARNEYVTDFKGFVTYVRDKGFQTYADKVGVSQKSVGGTPILTDNIFDPELASS